MVVRICSWKYEFGTENDVLIFYVNVIAFYDAVWPSRFSNTFFNTH